MAGPVLFPCQYYFKTCAYIPPYVCVCVCVCVCVPPSKRLSQFTCYTFRRGDRTFSEESRTQIDCDDWQCAGQCWMRSRLPRHSHLSCRPGTGRSGRSVVMDRYTHTHTHIHTHTHTHIHTHTRTHARMHTRTHAHTHHTHTRTLARPHARTHAHTRTGTLARTHAHTAQHSTAQHSTAQHTRNL